MLNAASGQRWASEAEPELGLGTVLDLEPGRITVHFPAAGERRTYARRSAPLQRVRFRAGDTVRARDGREGTVTGQSVHEGLIRYDTSAGEICEEDLADTLSHSKPEDRLRSLRVDAPDLFKLRAEALFRRAQMRKSPVRGFIGGRIGLLPHQLYIASEVASRLRPRVLLADETGLGKTIEAGLILHRLHLTGRAARILILVPEPLIHQWFVELLRRFHLLVSLFDEERCASIQAMDDEANPFLDSQLVLAGTDWLAGDAKRSAEAVAAGWDLLIVDEAHHLEWSPEAASPAWQLVDALARTAPGVLLLTATPQQLGPEGHFSRLRLLDPDRYTDLAAWQAESARYEEVAAKVETMLRRKAAPEEIARLVDTFGTGRVMFRNTRRNLSGFPERRAHLARVEDDAAQLAWLAELLRRTAPEKILLICASRELAESIQEQLRTVITVNSTLFHEGLTLLQRDRAAAWFSEEDGARLLLCSEIGSEGRNFQFAHHLVLWDLPENPELLEQRIGRLDRIGQTGTIHLHVPWQPGTRSEVLARWYADGMNSLTQNVTGAAEIAREVQSALETALTEFSAEALDTLIRRTAQVRAETERRLTRGHDRLLELSSSRPGAAQEIIARISEADADTATEAFLVRLLDHFGMNVDDLAPRSYLLQPGNLLTNSFPDIPEEGLSVTFDRERALSREDWSFLTQDHPVVRSACDALLTSPAGNACVCLWRDSGAQGLYLECLFVAECIAPAALHADRFLPPVPVRTVVDHELRDHSGDRRLLKAATEAADASLLTSLAPLREKLLPPMLEKSRAAAALKLSALTKTAATAAREHLQTEIDRLKALAAVNDHIPPEEIAGLHAHQTSLLSAIAATRLRLDAVRLIVAK